MTTASFFKRAFVSLVILSPMVPLALFHDVPDGQFDVLAFVIGVIQGIALIVVWPVTDWMDAFVDWIQR